jgi:tetratricopeptide (TPR) repeat protein
MVRMILLAGMMLGLAAPAAGQPIRWRGAPHRPWGEGGAIFLDGGMRFCWPAFPSAWPVQAPLFMAGGYWWAEPPVRQRLEKLDTLPRLQADPDIPPLTAVEHVHFGNVAMAEARFGGAVQHFSKAAQREPLDPGAAARSALALLAAGHPSKAAQTLKRALRLMPPGELMVIAPRQIYGASEREYDKHLRELEGAMARSPDDAALVILRAYLCWCDGQLDQARLLLGRAEHLAFDPTLLTRFNPR